MTSGGNEPGRAGRSLPTPNPPSPGHSSTAPAHQVPSPAPHQHLVLHHPTAVWCKHPCFLPLREVLLTDMQRALEMLQPQLTPAPTVQSVPRPELVPGTACTRAVVYRDSAQHSWDQDTSPPTPRCSWALVAQSLCSSTSSTSGSPTGGCHYNCSLVPLAVPLPHLDTRFVSQGQPGRDSDLSPEDVAQHRVPPLGQTPLVAQE